MILQLGIPLILIVMLSITLALAIAPTKLFGFLSSIYGYNLQPPAPPWKLRLIGIVQSIFVSAFIFIWWKSPK